MRAKAKRKNKAKFFYLFLAIILIGAIAAINKWFLDEEVALLSSTLVSPQYRSIAVSPTTVPTPTEGEEERVVEEENTKRIIIPTPTVDTTPWGIAKQISEHTWTMKVGEDERMGTPQEILTALNAYRQEHGRSSLVFDDKLNKFAKDRADYFITEGNTDEHKGFVSYMEDNGYDKLGFYSVGENSSIGYKVLGVHLIEWIYAADEGHNANQLNSKWSHVGIGVSGTATDLIFGGDRQ